MKYLITFTALFAANALQHLPILTGIGITLFSGLFIFTVMTAHTSPQWKSKFLAWRIPQVVKDAASLAVVLMIFAATAVVLIALADDGLTVMDVVRILVNV